MTKTITPFLMFEGRAEEAMNFYVSLFDSARIESITHYGPEQPGREGTVMRAALVINGQKFICIDSPAVHEFGFTPAFSIFVVCENEAELDVLFARLSEGGQVLMPLNNYGFSRKFAWVNDRFGVSWQINWE